MSFYYFDFVYFNILFDYGIGVIARTVKISEHKNVHHMIYFPNTELTKDTHVWVVWLKTSPDGHVLIKPFQYPSQWINFVLSVGWIKYISPCAFLQGFGTVLSNTWVSSLKTNSLTQFKIFGLKILSGGQCSVVIIFIPEQW